MTRFGERIRKCAISQTQLVRVAPLVFLALTRCCQNQSAGMASEISEYNGPDIMLVMNSVGDLKEGLSRTPQRPGHPCALNLT